MKFSIEIDATPKEVRELLGLPDVQPMWESMSQQLQEQVQAQLMSNPAAFMDPLGFGRQMMAAMQSTVTKT